MCQILGSPQTQIAFIFVIEMFVLSGPHSLGYACYGVACTTPQKNMKEETSPLVGENKLLPEITPLHRVIGWLRLSQSQFILIRFGMLDGMGAQTTANIHLTEFCKCCKITTEVLMCLGPDHQLGVWSRWKEDRISVTIWFFIIDWIWLYDCLWNIFFQKTFQSGVTERSADGTDLATYPADQYPAQWLFVAWQTVSFQVWRCCPRI